MHAQCLNELGRHGEAAAAAGRATSLRPDWVFGWLTLGRCQRNHGEFVGAVQVCCFPRPVHAPAYTPHASIRPASYRACGSFRILKRALVAFISPAQSFRQAVALAPAAGADVADEAAAELAEAEALRQESATHHLQARWRCCRRGSERWRIAWWNQHA